LHKINKVDHAIPHNLVIAEVTNQVTGEESLALSAGSSTSPPKNRSRSRSATLARSRWNLCSSLTKKIGPSTATRSPTAPLESIMRERIYIWVRDCAPDNTFTAEALLSELRDASEAYSAGHFIEADKLPELVNS
jgi:hypothetical protein